MGGGECCIPLEALNMLMQNCLQDMANTIAGEDVQITTVKLTLTPGKTEYDMPNGLSKPFTVMNGNCEVTKGLPVCPEPVKEDCPSSWDAPMTPPPPPPCPSNWWTECGKLHFDQVNSECVVSVRGIKEIDCTLFDVVNGVTVWRENPLPAELHTAYAKCVYGMAKLESDPQIGRTYMGIAADEVDTWMNRSEVDPSAKPARVRLGRRSRCTCRRKCGCG
jgi:hypothetical protein